MGRIIKYNVSKGESSRTQSSVTVVQQGYPTNNDVKQETSCNFWGNDWHGIEDLTGSMLINGDVNIVWDVDDEDNDNYDEAEGDEQPTGSLYVSGNVEAKSTYGKTVYLDYPEVGNKKTNLLDILKDFNDRITANYNDIVNLKSRMTTIETNVTNLNQRVDNIDNRVNALGERLELTINNVNENTQKIDNLYIDVDELYDVTDRLTDNIIDINGDIRDIYNKLGDGGNSGGGEIPNIYNLEFKEGRFATTTFKPTESNGSVNIPTKTSHLENDNNFITLTDVNNLEFDLDTPTILFSGTLVSDNNNGSLTWQDWTVKSSISTYNKHISSLAAIYQSQSNNWPALRLQLFSKSGYKYRITSITGLVTKAHDYDIESQTAGGNLRGKGYWMTGGVIDNGMTGIIQSWRTHDDNNDSVRADCLAYRCQEINVTIYGVVSKN